MEGTDAATGRNPDAELEPELELRGLRRRFGKTVAVDGLDLRLDRGEFVTLLGPSGCGKTTVLRLVAGFESPDGGRVLFRGEDVTAQSPQRRGFGMVFQNYALFPHLDVFGNVAFGLRSRGVVRAETERRVERALERVDLAGLGPRRVQQLSGGQQQRVALARALAIEPPLLLLDEPLSNLDAALRERTRVELRALVKELGITTLFVTHDQEEAFDLSDRIAVMRAGAIRQVGTPEELYLRPSGPFVAGFVGRANRFPVRLRETEGGPVALLEDGTAWGPEGIRTVRCGEGEGELPELWVRPEDLRLHAEGKATGEEGAGGAGRGPAAVPREAGGPAELAGRVADRRFQGHVTVYRVETAVGPVEVAAGREMADVGDAVRVEPAADVRLHLFVPEPGGSG